MGRLPHSIHFYVHYSELRLLQHVFLVVNVQEFLTSVHKFVEVAPLGEYSVRLNVLRAFSTDIYLQGTYILYHSNTVVYL